MLASELVQEVIRLSAQVLGIGQGCRSLGLTLHPRVRGKEQDVISNKQGGHYGCQEEQDMDDKGSGSKTQGLDSQVLSVSFRGSLFDDSPVRCGPPCTAPLMDSYKHRCLHPSREHILLLG